MLRRVLLALSVLAALVSVDSRPATILHEEHQLEPRGKPYSPVIVPVGEPTMLLGRHYQVVKRDPSPLNIPPALASQLAQAKGEAPPAPSSTPAAKRNVVPMPRYIYERDTYGTNYLSNVGPAPAAYPSYKPYQPPQQAPPAPPANTTANALDGGESHSADDKQGLDGGERKSKAKSKGTASKASKNKQTKHKSE